MPEPCPYCGSSHPSVVCYKVKAFEYWPDGTLKRVEFRDDTPVQIQPYYPPNYPPNPNIQPIPFQPHFGSGSGTIRTQNLKAAYDDKFKEDPMEGIR